MKLGAEDVYIRWGAKPSVSLLHVKDIGEVTEEGRINGEDIQSPEERDACTWNFTLILFIRGKSYICKSPMICL